METISVNGINLLETATSAVTFDYIMIIVFFVLFFLINAGVFLYGKIYKKNIKTDVGFELVVICSSILNILFALVLVIGTLQYCFNYNYLLLSTLREITTQELVDYGYE